jgi:hypothetical protein
MPNIKFVFKANLLGDGFVTYFVRKTSNYFEIFFTEVKTYKYMLF